MTKKSSHEALLIGLASRIVVILAVLVSFYTLYTFADWPRIATDANSFPFIGLFDRWDSGYYLKIALNGYPTGYPDLNYWTSNGISIAQGTPLAYPEWAFFPLYSAVIRAVGILFVPFLTTTHAFMLSGFVVSNITFFVSVYFLYKLSNKIFDQRIALIATVFYSFWGGASFYSAIYSEALFMALALGAFYYLEENKLYKATLLGFLASFTRSNGFLIFIPFLIYALQSRKDKPGMLKLILLSVVVAMPYLLWNLVGYFVAGGVFPIRDIAYNLNWIPPIFITTQIANYISGNTLLQLFYIIGLALIFMPAVYVLVSRVWLKSFKNVWIQETKTLKYWGLYASLIFIILTQSYLFSIIRYAVLMLPIYWASASIYTKNRAVGLILFSIMTAMLIIGAALFTLSGSYM